jgi:hypothetical protein
VPVTVVSGFEYARAVADAVLYEGYLLYPYGRSSSKNRVRWQFGVVVPRVWARARGLTDTSVAGSAEGSWQQTECLLEARQAIVHGRVRFLQLQRKSVEEQLSNGAYRMVDSLDTGARLELGFDEAVPQEFDFEFSLRDALAGERQFSLRIPGGEDAEPVVDGEGRLAGRVVRRRWPLAVSVTVSAARCGIREGVGRLRVRVDNVDEETRAEASREVALRRSLLACHVLLGTSDGAFLSLLEPPRWAEQATKGCANVHTFPVLAGRPADRDVILSSPVLLYDHPRVAPESPGDLHDATEIDEILSLRALTLTEAEKREARGTDRRAAEILERTESLPPEAFSRLHGAVRSLRPVAAGTADADSVLVAGVVVARGSRVRLRPRRRGVDPQDRFLDGRIAHVEAVLTDVDDAKHLAVTLEDDPAADLNRWYGRFRYFSPDEIEPLPAAAVDGRHS